MRSVGDCDQQGRARSRAKKNLTDRTISRAWAGTHIEFRWAKAEPATIPEHVSWGRIGTHKGDPTPVRFQLWTIRKDCNVHSVLRQNAVRSWCHHPTIPTL